MGRNRSTLYIIAAIVLVLVIGLLGFVPLAWRWVSIMIVLGGLLAFAGREITGDEVEVRLRSGRTEKRFIPGRMDGVLIDSRNKISLSRLQLILWTVIVLSAWGTFALHRIIPVLEGRLPGAGAVLVGEVAGLLGGGEADNEAATTRAMAVLEQIMGADSAAEAGAAETVMPYSPLDVAIPQEVLLALGISIASLAGAGLIKTNQATNDEGRALDVAATRTDNATQRAGDRESALESLQAEKREIDSPSGGGLESTEGGPPLTQEEMEVAQARLAQLEIELKAAKAAADSATRRAAELKAAQTLAVGELHAYTTPAEARWSDMLRGDTVANFQYTDLGKVQMFFFTIILVFSYAALIWSIMSMPAAPQVLQLVPQMSLPQFSDSFVVTMALSHGGYLATKAAV